jgi:beta-lactam-binding protein with PASTA domain
VPVLPTTEGMASRLRAHLPRVALFVLLGLAATATLTYAAGRPVSSTPAASATVAPKPPLVVPDVRNQAFVFAKGALEDSGFAWRVLGSVHGYAANTVVAQSPAAGTRVLDTGAPLITLTLHRNSAYPQSGASEDVSPYRGTVLQPANLAAAVGPAHASPTAAPVVTKPKVVAPVTPTVKPATVAKTATKTTWPQNRPAAFTVPGARTEPLDEMPLPTRALELRSWLDAHPTKSSANVAHWLYQNAWIVTGAKFGWWHGAEALTTLIAVDRRAQQLWGIGSKSALQARSALSEVQSRSK